MEKETYILGIEETKQGFYPVGLRPIVIDGYEGYEVTQSYSGLECEEGYKTREEALEVLGRLVAHAPPWIQDDQITTQIVYRPLILKGICVIG